MRDDEHFEYGEELNAIEKITITFMIIAFVVASILFMKVE